MGIFDHAVRRYAFWITSLEFASMMLRYLDARQSGPKTAKPISPTLHRYASVLRKRDLSQYLEDEKKKGAKTTATMVNTAARGITPIYNAPVVGPSAKGESDPKKPFFRPFEHPFVLISDCIHIHSPIWKEYGPEAGKSLKSGQPWPVLHWHCPVGYCPFVLPPPKPCASSAARNTRSSLKSKHTPMVRKSLLNANRARPGYCECCYERYSDLDKHVRSIFHRQFALEDKNYHELDNLLLHLVREPLTCIVALPQQSELLRSPVSQKSTISSSNGSIGRNYTANKRAKQTMALKTFCPNERENSSCQIIPTSPSFKRRRSSMPKLFLC